MPRNPDRIDVVLNKIRDIWVENPELRLGQLIINSYYHCSLDQLYNVEDEKLLEFLKELEKSS